MAQIHPVNPERYRSLAEFLAVEHDCDSPGLWRQRLAFWWDENPVAKQVPELGWTVEDDDEVVGFLGAIPTPYQIGGRVVPALTATTWRVRPAYRHLSMKLLFRLLAAARDSVLFNTTPNATAQHIFDSLGFRRFPEQRGPDRVSFVLLDVRGQLREKLGEGAVGASTAWVMSPLIKSVQAYRLRCTPTPVLPVRQVLHADRAFDDLWEGTRDRYPTTAVRSADVLNWFCFGPTRDNFRLFACFRGDHVVGYCICWIRQTKQSTRVECVDLWTDFAHTDVIRSLVCAVIGFAREREYDCLIVPHFNAAVAGVLRDIGMFERTVRRPKQYFKAMPDLASQVTGSDLYVTDLQGDATFFS